MSLQPDQEVSVYERSRVSSFCGQWRYEEGKSLLVAPVTKPMYYDKNSAQLTGVDKRWDVYLPKGKDEDEYCRGYGELVEFRLQDQGE